MKITKNANAKINLTLDVLNKRSDGYHNISSVMQSVCLCDTVTVEKTATRQITGEWNMGEFTEENTAAKAAAFMLKRYNLDGGVHISIVKRIPLCAGLGGGSADAAAVIEAINEIYRLNAETQELIKIGQEIGADVPFCLLKGAALAEGLGELLTPIVSRVKCEVVLVKPDVDISTGEIYEKIDSITITDRPKADMAIAAMKAGDLHSLCRSLNNVMELVTQREHPIIETLKEELTSQGAIGALMSGSGSTVYGLFARGGKEAAAYLEDKYGFSTFCCELYYPDRGF